MQRYFVDFYDGFDGWCGPPTPEIAALYADRLFDDLDAAKIRCDELQAGLDQNNKDFGEHYSVVELDISGRWALEAYRGH